MRADSFVAAAGWLLPMSSPPVRDGAILVRDGRIEWIGPRPLLPPAGAGGRLIAYPRSIILPGWINAHTHLNLTAAAGLPRPTPSSFTQWVRRLLQITSGWSEDLVLKSIRAGLDLSLAGGATAVVHQSTAPPLRPFLEHPLRSVVLHEVIGFPQSRCEKLLLEAENWLSEARKACRGTRVTPGLAVHALYSTGPDLACALADLAERQQAPLAIHLSESEEELRFLNDGSGPIRDLLEERNAWDPVWIPPARTPVALAEELGLLKLPLLAVHCNYLTSADRAALVRSPAAVVWCPGSHAFFGHAEHPAPGLVKAGVTVLLGTDSLASNSALDMLREVRLAAARGSEPGGEEWLRSATVESARHLRGAAGPGRLAAGEPADFQIVTSAEEIDDPVEVLLRGTLQVKRVLIDGNICLPGE